MNDQQRPDYDLERDLKAYGESVYTERSMPGYRRSVGHCTCGLREGLKRDPQYHKPPDGGPARWRCGFCGKDLKTVRKVVDGQPKLVVDDGYYDKLDRM